MFLSSTPAGTRIGDVKVNTSVRQWEIELDAAVTYPAFEASHVPNLRDVQAMYLADNWPAFRTWGISGVTAWSLSRHWLLRPGVGTEDSPCEVDWDNLQRSFFQTCSRTGTQPEIMSAPVRTTVFPAAA